MHQLDYDDNSFDLIVSGWTLRYSNNVYKALSEILRVIKPGGLALLVLLMQAKQTKKKFKSKTNKTKDNDIYSTNQIKEYFKDNIRTVYFEFDAFKDNPDVSRASIYF